MILGMSVAAFTILHVIISLIGIATGLLVLIAMGGGRYLQGMTTTFLLSTVLTSVTGFFFHSASFGPPHEPSGLAPAHALRAEEQQGPAGGLAPHIPHRGTDRGGRPLGAARLR